jgi:ABC-2 type transport system permease protein
MAAKLERRPLAATPLHRVSFLRRLYGLGSLFGKTLRDSRRAALIVGGFLIFIWLTIGSAIASTFGTLQARAEGITLTTSLPPILLGLYGGTQPNVVTLGGFANWRYGAIFLLVPGVWSLLALSATLVHEARRGSLDFLAAGPVARRRIAFEKLAAHGVAMAVVMVAVAIVSWLVGMAFATLSPAEIAALGGRGADQIALADALSYALLMGLVALATGSIAFALAPFVGRGAAAGIAGLVMAGGWVIYGYRESIPIFDALRPLSWYSWTAGHRPIAGTFDWPSLLPLAAIILVGSVVGVLAFERRDLGAIGSVRMPGLPRALLGVGGPLGRMFGDRVAGALGWGLGLGLLAFVIAASGDQLRESIAAQPSIAALFAAAFPNIDLNAPGFGLQVGFLAFGYLGCAVAAGTLVAGWASDETEGRLEMVLATSASRARWFLRSGLGVFGAIVVVTLVVALGIAIGVAATGENPLTATLGTAVLALYGAAVAGIGFAVAGLFRSSHAAAAVYVLAGATILLDIVVPMLRLPDWVHDLALTAHFGAPMVGTWDPAGIALSLALALGGLAVGAWGFTRRDLRA